MIERFCSLAVEKFFVYAAPDVCYPLFGYIHQHGSLVWSELKSREQGYVFLIACKIDLAVVYSFVEAGHVFLCYSVQFLPFFGRRCFQLACVYVHLLYYGTV